MKDSAFVDPDDRIRFGLLVHDISRLRRIVVDRALKPLGVTRSQWWILVFLSRRDGMTQSALAAELDLTKVALGKLLERLEVADLVARRGDESDARLRRVYLTGEGHDLLRNIKSHVETLEGKILGPNTQEELELVVAALRRMKQTLLAMINEDYENRPRIEIGDIDRTALGVAKRS